MKALASARSTWGALAPRERRLVRAALGVVLLGLLWGLLLAPPLKALRSSAERHARVDAQWQQMQQLQAQAEQLKAAPRQGDVDAPAELRQSSQALLGAGATLSINAGRATVALSEVPAAALAAWLAQVRSSAQALPEQAQLKQVPGGEAARWSGSVVLALPAP
ncbi:type II secretion system protein GspM [Comamonas sp. NLF-1-9]|uniref:type II secretion system protein GspM n=1 Tax=Comamonas sp. NLF-1-9 TaxID=2853163 RepID=UPI001C4849D0|nr:type II secretion system protein GspM [Comamonas sp. NLF-1-9]QXL83445.1 type II secretion system protein M [Comamonas sp. NLF-1-9]